MGPLAKFLLSLANLVRSGGIRKLDQALKFAKQQSDIKLTPLVKKQIEMVFKKAKKPESGTKKKGEVVPMREGIESLDEFNLSKDDPMGDLEKIVKGEGDTGLPKVNPTNMSTGLTRTIAREILMKRGIELSKGMDPIEVFRKTFGQDSLGDVANLAEELLEMDRMGRRPKPLTEIIEQEGFFDIKMPKEPPQGFSADDLAKIQKEIDEEEVLKKFDPTDRKPNAEGGLNSLMASAPDPMDERNSVMENLSRQFFNRPLKDLSDDEIIQIEEMMDEMTKKPKEAPSIKLAGGGLAYLMGM